MQQALKNDIGSVDVFLLLTRGNDMRYDFWKFVEAIRNEAKIFSSSRFDSATQELLLWYETIFGKSMWNNVIMESTYWSHSIVDAEARDKERGGVSQNFRYWIIQVFNTIQ